MSKLTVPEWLVSAIPMARSLSVQARPGDAVPGDICRVAMPATAGDSAAGRLVLILDADMELGIASVMLLHTDFDVRTNMDVLLGGEEVGLPFGLAMETDLVGPVALESLAGSAIGRVPEDLLDELRDAVDLAEVSDRLAARVGVALRGQSNSRWEWKLAEGVVLDRLISEYALAPHEVASPIHMLADALRSLGKAREEDDVAAITSGLLAYMGSRDSFPPNVLPMLGAPQVANALGTDMWRALAPMLHVA